ncbi:related to citrate lyase beta subunit [Cephalotrichum gorgonifer]|uniref:Related to citrate lyase beta subunit n=1 Tax=Cephalotrichum gorgonifer TaxID=2041049 RepID=A0AAE8MRQ2_9PEZI|nr:related to citrate lyase beta subunit [Cephalotrichum gorgonifer]
MAARSPSIIRRSLLYVPASSQKMLAKSLAIPSDNVTYDLEDSVTPSLKSAARDQLRSHLTNLGSGTRAFGELAVRINAVSTSHALQDLTSLVASPNLDAVVVPKVESAADLTFVTDVLRHTAPERHQPSSGNAIKIIALIESARAIMNLGEICKATPQLSGLIFAAEDFALDLSLTRTPSLREFLYARSAIVTAARAASLPSSIDLVCTSFRGEPGLKTLADECEDGKALGFNGKQCIHPSQLDVVHRLFSPSDRELEWAARILVANEKAVHQGRGAWTMDGSMIDAPVIGKAAAIAERATKCGIQMGKVLEKWSHQEPE